MSANATVHDFRVGLRLGCPLGVAAFVYLALTLDAPHRPLLVAISAVAALVAASVLVSPLKRRIVRGNVDAHLTWWCASFVVLATALCLLDNALHSPFVAVLFVSVAFAATALPIRGVVIMSALNLLALAAIGAYEAVVHGDAVDALVLWGAGLIATALAGASVSNERSRRAAALRYSQEEVVHRLARVVEFRDNDTGGHVDRMSRYSGLVAEALGCNRDQCRELELAAALHDVGKVAVPDAILLKPGRLTAEERQVMERHCRAGFDMLAGSGSALLDLAATIALTHHERYDGNGYPAGLRGDDIPLPARIVSVADVFDALTSARVYKQAMSIADALEIIRDGRGTQFDAHVVDAFISQLDSITALYAASSQSLDSDENNVVRSAGDLSAAAA
jgi:HD-GYP domain-containing protein (c-di-GMP phosphodiesterase class II)